MTHKKVFKYISNITFGIGGAFAIYTAITSFIITANLPSGVCPIDNSRPFMYIAIGLLAISLITSFFGEKKKKQSKKNNS